ANSRRSESATPSGTRRSSQLSGDHMLVADCERYRRHQSSGGQRSGGRRRAPASQRRAYQGSAIAGSFQAYAVFASENTTHQCTTHHAPSSFDTQLPTKSERIQKKTKPGTITMKP